MGALSSIRRAVGSRRWAHQNRLRWYQQFDWPKEAPTWIVEAKKRRGKTRYMAVEACRDMRAGVRVASNFTIRDRVTGQHTERADNWIDVLRLSVDALENGQHIRFYIDELHLWMDSRAFKLTPAWFRGWLAQSGHYGAGICGSVQNLRRLEVVARELVDELYVIRKMYFKLFFFWGPIVPLQWRGEVDPDSVGADGMGAVEGYRFVGGKFWFPRWWAGYDTRELIQVDTWESSPALEAEVERLTVRAAQLVAPGLISSYSDGGTGAQVGSADERPEWVSECVAAAGAEVEGW